MTVYAKSVSIHKTPQIQKVPKVKKQKRNNAGGISFKVNNWALLERFLIIGTEGGTYYVNEQKLTKDSAKAVQKCINENGIKTVDIIVDISKNGQAVSNDPAIFTLALAASCVRPETRKYALSKLGEVCRIGTHLFTFVANIKELRGFGRGLREAIANWYTSKDMDSLAYQMLKYQQRNGWSHRDVLRLAHPVPTSEDMDMLFKYATGKTDLIPDVSNYAIGMRKARTSKRVSSICDAIKKYKLTHEVLNTEVLKNRDVWESLFITMPYMAMVRNLGRMANLGMHKPMSGTVAETCDRLTNYGLLKRARIHPISLLNAYITYIKGHGVKGSLVWDANTDIAQALEEAFYASFNVVEPTEKRILMAVDISGSMTWTKVKGMSLTPMEASLTLALVTNRIEKTSHIMAFADTLQEFGLQKNATLTQAIKRVNDMRFGGTDCSLPMQYCIKNEIDVDAIVIYTDSETYSGNIHPWQALDNLEQKLGHEVKLVVCAMDANKFSIARPDYENMLDVVGFSTNTPQAISQFIR